LPLKPKFFATPDKFRTWLDKNHHKQAELWVGYHKKATGKPSITWPESVDQALCYGWIDGLRKSLDDSSYMIRFTPRKPDSHWSKVNVNKVKELQKRGLMLPAGLTAFKKMSKNNSGLASFEQENIKMPAKYLAAIKKNKKAWTYFMNEAPSYRKQVTWWIISAKQESTRIKRLQSLIEDSEGNQRVKPLRWTKKS